MAASADVIKEFLVGLGFKIDEKGQKRFVDTIGAATVQAVALGAATTAAATAVVAGVAKMSDSLEQLYFASQRSKASVESIQALDFAARQFGAGARDAVESIGRFMRSSPGAASFLNNLGVQTQTANGQLRDTGDILTDLGARLKEMPYYRAKAYADFLGIDERTLMALQQGLGEFSKQYRDMLHAAHLDSDQAAKAAHGFMVELRTLGGAADILFKKAASELAGGLSDQIRRFREWLVSNFDEISAAIVKVAQFVIKVGDILITIVQRIAQAGRAVAEWFQGADQASKDLLKTIALLAAGWRTFSLLVSMSPVGRILALAGALALLFDDYQVWKNGGKSLIDWGNWTKEIDEAVAAIDKLASALEKLAKFLGFNDTKKYVDSSIQEAKDIANIVERFLSGDGPGAMQIIRERRARNGAAPEGENTTAPASGDARGIRNNNPGNLNYIGQPGASLEDHDKARFAKWKTAREGLQALANQLRLDGSRGLDTIRGLMEKYAPRSENDTDGYIQFLSGFMGIDPNEHFDVKTDPAALSMLMRGIIQKENGYNPYSRGQIDDAIGSSGLIGGGAGAQISQKTEINIHGVDDPQAAGQAVAREQNTVNERLVRNLKGAVQ
ncbi:MULTISPECIES: hypothetical protein [unclassified Achromobacter]|uniref:hypothetical protein n=1 Tax=unclassified Achromobacter TaxID=2626865 RepID=UPI000B5183BF|nr:MULTISPECIES: hypothetical protein [unclassified Achromobacter]OWT69209.1 hypothetical protein CEY05_28700 [Achromobacter sp. HZ34]OWT70614.1 hypothetical protein CEY04_27530 [Achromobacter sp. HZ28]